MALKSSNTDPLQRAIHRCKILGACEALHEGATLEEVCALIHAPQGREFLLKGEPTPALWQAAKKVYGGEFARRKIFIDAGDVFMPSKGGSFVAVGATTLHAQPSSCELYRYTLLHGARAIVNASGWAVVNVAADKESTPEVRTSEHAMKI